MKKHGLDTVLSIFDAATQQEVYMLDPKHWGSISTSDVKAWDLELQEGVFLDGSTTQRHPVCPFDLRNQAMAGEAIMNSITHGLWERIYRDVGSAPTGAAALHAIVQDAQVSTASMIQNLTNKLSQMSLKQEPGQDVLNFSEKITDLAQHLEGSAITIPNLESLVIAPYLHCDVEAFRTYATQLHFEADTRCSTPSNSIKSAAANAPAAPHWSDAVDKLKSRFRHLQAHGWPPLNSTSKAMTEVQELCNEINTLRQSIQSGGRGSRGQSDGGRGGHGGGRGGFGRGGGGRGGRTGSGRGNGQITC